MSTANMLRNDILNSGGGTYVIDEADSFTTITLGAAGNLVIAGAAHVDDPIVISSGTQVTLASSSAVTVLPDIVNTDTVPAHRARAARDPSPAARVVLMTKRHVSRVGTRWGRGRFGRAGGEVWSPMHAYRAYVSSRNPEQSQG